MSQVLKFVNSSYFGFKREIGSVQQALTLVGTRAVTNFALWNAVFSVIPNPKYGPFDLKGLWQDSLRRAILARALGRQIRLNNAEDLFAGALLQDMAIPLLLQEMPETYQKLVERRTVENRRLSGLEREAFGWDHAEAAAKLAEKWSLPVEFADLIRDHTQLEPLLTRGDSTKAAACVALASMLPSCSDPLWNERDPFVDGFERLTNEPVEVLQDLLQQTDERTAEFAPLLKLPAPEKTLSEFWETAS